MEKLWPTLAIVALLLLVFGAMWWTWRGRTRRDAGLQPVRELPDELGATLLDTTVLYVATTRHEQPLERLAIDGLGFRARADLSVHDAGIVLSIPSAPLVFVPRADVVGSGPATVTIDRVVEKDGMIRLSWRLAAADGTPLLADSYFRALDPADHAGILSAFAASAAPASAPAPAPTESEA